MRKLRVLRELQSGISCMKQEIENQVSVFLFWRKEIVSRRSPCMRKLESASPADFFLQIEGVLLDFVC